MMWGSGRKQPERSSLEDQVNHDASYQRTVKGQAPDDPDKEGLTLQGTIGTTWLPASVLPKQCRACAMREISAFLLHL